MSPSALKVYFDFIIFNFIVKNIFPVNELKKENIKNNASVDRAEESCPIKNDENNQNRDSSMVVVNWEFVRF